MQSNQIIIINGTLRVIGAFLLLSRRAHLLTTCEAGGGIPPSGRAVRSARRIALSAESARQCRRACELRSSLPVRLADGCRLICIFAANRCLHPGQPATRLRKPATGSFAAEIDDAIPHRPFSFVCAKRNKNASLREQKGRDPLWRSIIWKLRS